MEEGMIESLLPMAAGNTSLCGISAGGVADRTAKAKGVWIGCSAHLSPLNRSTARNVCENGTEQWASSRRMRLSCATSPAKIEA
jgi:hypothetical protein